MSDYKNPFVIDREAEASIPVVGESRPFPVRRIWCVGRNYAEHAKEMGHDPDREPPFFFAKPSDSVVPEGGDISFPVATSNLHHEVELAVAIGSGGRNIDLKQAESLIYGYAVALDMTRRDLQQEAKRLSRPWAIAKGFDQSCPISAIRPKTDTGPATSGSIELQVNGNVRQTGDLSEMIWSTVECLSILSNLVELKAGDLLLTGTPAGVGSVNIGDQLTARIDRIGELSVRYQ
jgi:fumarylpyruvate hydrolase